MRKIKKYIAWAASIATMRVDKIAMATAGLLLVATFVFYFHGMNELVEQVAFSLAH